MSPTLVLISFSFDVWHREAGASCHQEDIFMLFLSRISELICLFKKCGKVISLLAFLEYSLWPLSLFVNSVCHFGPEKSSQNWVKKTFRLFIIDHTALSILRPPVVLITLLCSRFWNARLFFAHCRISCRGIMEVGMGRPLPINILHSTRQLICQELKGS